MTQDPQQPQPTPGKTPDPGRPMKERAGSRSRPISTLVIVFVAVALWVAAQEFGWYDALPDWLMP